jgi:hypothetical protein
MEIRINDDYRNLYYISICSFTDTILATQYLNCNFEEFIESAKKYNAVFVRSASRPFFKSYIDAENFVNNWAYPRLTMNTLINGEIV